MSETNWRSPGAIIGVLTALVAVVGLYFTFVQNKRDDKKLDIDTEQTLKDQNRKDDAERTKRMERQEKIDRINERIEKVDKEIERCRDIVGTAQQEARMCLDKQEGNCDGYIDKAKHYTAEWEKLESEKKELQNQLNSF